MRWRTDPRWGWSAGGVHEQSGGAHMSTGGTRGRSAGGALLSGAVLLAVAGCGDAAPPVPAQVLVTPGSATAETVGATVQYAAQVLDAQRNVIAGATVSWSTEDQRVATVSPTGLATVTGPGRARMRATHETISGSATLAVELRPASMTKVAGDSTTAPATTVLPERPTVRVADAGGAPIPDVEVRFAVVSGGGQIAPLRALTDADGQASTRWTLGDEPGQQTLRAETDDFQAEFVATATEPPLRVDTRQLKRARLTLAYRAAMEAKGGTGPYLWSLADGALPTGLALADDGAISGTPEAMVTSAFSAHVRDANGNEATRDLTIEVCGAPLSLQPGAVYRANASRFSGCPPFLPAGSPGDRYRIGVVRTGYSTDLTYADMVLTITESGVGSGGVGSAAVGASAASRAAPPHPSQVEPQSALPRRAPRLLPSLEAAVRRADAMSRMHARLYEEAVRLRARFGRQAVLPDMRPALDPAGHRAAPQLAPPSDRITILPYDSDRDDRCSPPSPSPAVAHLVAYDAHLAVYQDSAQRAANPVAVADVQRVLEYYDAYGAGTIDDYFGRVPDTNGDGRVVVFITPVADDVAAFVWPGDYLDSRCASSNQMELVYFNASMFHAVGGAPDDGHYQAMGTMVHEVKHVQSLYNRLRAESFHPTWIEEGGAEVAAEISSRRAMAAVGGVPVGAVLTRDAYPPRSGSIITPENYAVLVRLVRTMTSYIQEYNSLTTDPADGHTFYGTSWHFHRFLGDAYGGAADQTEAPFFAALNDSLTPSGAAGIRAVTGRALPALIEEYATAMMLNGTGAPQPARSFTTYDFPSATHELLRPQSQPAGLYPWPVTGPAPAPFESAVYTGELAPAGIRFHEFESDGHGDGIDMEVHVTGAPARVIVARVR